MGFLCLLLATWLSPQSSHAQCGTTTNTGLSYSITRAQCNGTNYLFDGYTPTYGIFKPPFTNPVVISATGGTPTVFFSNDTLFFQGLIYNASVFPHATVNIRFLDSCGNTDTIQINDYNSPTYLQLLQNNGTYSLCDSSFRVGIMESGLNNFVFTAYNSTTGVYDTVAATVTVTADSLIAYGLPPSYYTVYYNDSCGTAHIQGLNGYANNYSYYIYSGQQICDSIGIYATLKPQLYGPFTFVGYTITGTATAAPSVQIAGDSIVIGNAIPYNSYSLNFLDGCNDTFNVQYYAINTAPGAFYPVLAQKGCSTYSLYVKTTGGPYYDVQMESGLVAPSLGYTYYPDSLVITGLPVDSMNNTFVLSFRDSGCHNRQYISYSLLSEGFSNNGNTIWSPLKDSCGIGYSTFIRLAGLPPYTNLTWLKGPNTPAVAFSGDTVRLSGLVSLINEQQDTLYAFSLKDSCGNTDTFYMPSYIINSNGMTDNIVYNSGGCSGSNNASAKIVLNNPYDPTAFPNPYSGLSIAGAGSTSVMVSGDTLSLSSLIPDSVYIIRFQDSCHHLFRYKFTASSSNIPMVLSVVPSVQGVCVKTLDSNYAMNVTVTNPNYPYIAYLSGPVADTINNVNINNFIFSDLPIGTYQIKVEDVCHNIQTLNYTLVSAGTLVTSNYAYFSAFKGCDSFIYNFTRSSYTTASPAGLVNNIKFRGPYTAYVVRGVDTFWSYNSNAADTTNIQILFTFPSLSYVNPLDVMTVIDGCGDTSLVSVSTPYLYYGPATFCDSGVLSSRYIVQFNQGYNYNFPLRLTYTSGTLTDTSAIYFNNAAQIDTFYFKSGESACYRVTDTCHIYLGDICFSGPPAIYSYYSTRICSPATSGPGKGNVNTYTINIGADSVLYHEISGPAVLRDTTVPYGGLEYINIDTGTYVMMATEKNTCGRTYTYTMRVEPYLDSLSSVFVSGCLNANKLVVYYYNNQYSADYHTLSSSANTAFYTYLGSTYTYFQAGDTVYNIPSNTDLYLHAANGCSNDTVHSPAYTNPVIAAAAGFRCGSGYSIAIKGDKGVLPYTYEILSGSPVNYSAPTQSSNVFTGLPNTSGNTYQVRIADACGNAFTTLVRADSVTDPFTEAGISCIGNNYTASVDSIPQVNYTWTGPNGFTHTGTSISFNPVTTADTGIYLLYITNTSAVCATDTIEKINVRSCGPVLGLEGITLYAQWQGDQQALVYWSDVSAHSVSYQVQRSADGYSFTTLSSGKKEAYGSAGQGYRYTDEQPFNKNYYRIKVTEQDGTQGYSNVVQLLHNAGAGMNAVITGNGTDRDNKLQVYNCSADMLHVDVYNIQGSLVHHISIPTQKAATAVYELPTGLVPGLYMVRLKSGSESMSLKWSVIK